MNIGEAFNRHEDEYLNFDRIDGPRHPRPDLCAFLMLDDLVPGSVDMVSAAEHDEIFLDVDCDALAEVVNDDQVRDLTRCGIRYDSEFDCLAMFV